MLRWYPEYLCDCLLVSNEWFGDYNPLGGIEWSAIELRFAKTGCKELASFAVCHRILWRDVPPSFAVNVSNNSVDDRIRYGGLQHCIHNSIHSANLFSIFPHPRTRLHLPEEDGKRLRFWR